MISDDDNDDDDDDPSYTCLANKLRPRSAVNGVATNATLKYEYWQPAVDEGRVSLEVTQRYSIQSIESHTR